VQGASQRFLNTARMRPAETIVDTEINELGSAVLAAASVVLASTTRKALATSWRASQATAFRRSRPPCDSAPRSEARPRRVIRDRFG
jgi:hypothetical protein